MLEQSCREHELNLLVSKIIYIPILTPEGMNLLKKKICCGRTFLFPQSTGQLSANQSEVRQS